MYICMPQLRQLLILACHRALRLAKDELLLRIEQMGHGVRRCFGGCYRARRDHVVTLVRAHEGWSVHARVFAPEHPIPPQS